MSAAGSRGIRTGRRWPVIAAAALCVAAAACDAGRDVLTPTGPAAAHGAVEQTSQEFARTLALALKEPGTRGVVHQAMRDSRFTEHKLVLQDFLFTDAGGRLIGAMAAAGGTSEAAVRGWARQLPLMDFYVPFVEHRRAWTGTGDVVVAASLDVDDTRFTGYTPGGASLAFDSRAGTPAQTVIFLHPAEPKGLRARSHPGKGGRGAVEDPSEPTGPLLVIEPAENDPVGGGSGSVATYAGRLYQFRNYAGDGVGGIELMVKHYAGQGGTRISEEVMGEDSHAGWIEYHYDEITTANRTMSFASSGTTWIRVWERDSGLSEWGNGDEFWGEGAFGGFSVVHRFDDGALVKYITADHSCRRLSDCPEEEAKVDIVYKP